MNSKLEFLKQTHNLFVEAILHRSSNIKANLNVPWSIVYIYLKNLLCLKGFQADFRLVQYFSLD